MEAASGGRLADPRPGKTALPLKAILPDPELMQDVRDVAARGEQDPSFLDRFAIPLREQDLHAPIPRPGKVLCLGLNYRDHAAESGAEVPDEPVIFSKAPSSVIGPGDPIRLPETSDQVDYEVELAFVIGAPARNVHASQAMYHVAGYTVLNDVTARDYQHVRGGGQWTLAKSFDTFCPIGPWIVTPDEVPDPHDLTLECRIGGEVLQSGSTSEMIFKIPQIIEYLSAVLTLEPGDVVGTGTPPGVGFARTPQRFLQAGDLLECTVQSIGTLVNPVRA
ncbi:MAG: hypothetical protein AMK73_02025 [Planctomycetes bacterium SM23_32]|nr:MAG: hypothetical protein AMK73_02025 [Planctomycetes bacterium SM23_32]